MEPRSEVELIQQVGEWSIKNFGRDRYPHLGVIEEIGETTHCILKRRQHIRKFADMAYFIEQLTDALADAMIYLADWCHLNNSYFVFDRSPEPPVLDSLNEERILNHLLQACSVLLSLAERESDERFSVSQEGTYNMVAQRICTGLELLAKMWNVNLRLAVSHIWDKVSQRDWKKNPAGND